jgi:hypothetical protein
VLIRETGDVLIEVASAISLGSVVNDAEGEIWDSSVPVIILCESLVVIRLVVVSSRAEEGAQHVLDVPVVDELETDLV